MKIRIKYFILFNPNVHLQSNYNTVFRPRKKQEKEKIKLSKESWKKAFKLFAYLKPYKIKFGIGMLMLLFSSLTSMLFPGLAGKLVDASSGDTSTSDSLLNLNNINSIALILLIVFIVQSVLSFFRIYLHNDVTERMLAKLRNDTYSHLIRMPMNFFSQQRVGELNSRIAADIGLLQETFTSTLAEFIRQIIIIIAGIALLVFYSWKLTLIMLATLPVMIVIAVIFGKFIRNLSKDTQSKISESNVIVEETFTGIANVKAFANEFFETMRYSKSTEEIRQVAMRAAVWRGAFASFIIFALFGSIVLVIWQGVLLKEAGEIQIGELFSFILYSVFVGASFGGTADLFARIQKAVGATEHLFDLLDQTPEDIDLIAVHPEKSKIEGALHFNNVSFHYASRPDITVLKNIDFAAHPGENIAIVGPSGAGKSTLVSLVLRFYEPTNGTIRIDGKHATDFSLNELRSQMAIVPQEVLLFGGSIRENIAYGKPDASDEEIQLAAEKANAHEFIQRFPDGMNTLVGERGIQLSGGQRQRIAIARAILKNPKILILDEATSSLDSESERLVQDALESLMQNRTSIVIAHRLSTIRKANRILVLENGEIVEQGSHNELIEKSNGVYQKLSKLQFEGA